MFHALHSHRRLRTFSTSLAGRQLHFEPLEVRLAPAILGLDIQLLADTGGQPGQPISNVEDLRHDSLEVGDFFWVQVLVWDQRDDDSFPSSTVAGDETPGVISLPLNISWNPAIIGFAGQAPPESPQTIPLTNLAITPDFPVQRLVDDFDPAAGTITSLRGAALPAGGNGQAIGRDGPLGTVGAAWFSRLRFQALAESETPFTMQLAGSMSFTDGAALDNVLHLVPGPMNQGMAFELATRDSQNRPQITEFIQITDVAMPERQSLSGFVYADTNLNGMLDRDAGGMPLEPGLPNVTVRLFANGQAAVLDEVTTGPDGAYHFEIAAPGTYRIEELQPANFVDAGNQLGLVLPPAEPRGIVGVNQFSNIRLDAGESGVDYNFGENLRRITKRMFLSSTRPREVLCEELGIDCLTLDGTEGNDQIVVEEQGNVLAVTGLPGGPREFPLDQTQIVMIDARGGNDTVTLRGATGDDVAMLSPGTGLLRRGQDYVGLNYAVMVVSAEQVTAEGGPAGDDLAILRDSPASDALQAGENTPAGANSVILSNMDFLARAIAFDRVRAISARDDIPGEQDTADVQAVDFVLDLVGDWQS